MITENSTDNIFFKILNDVQGPCYKFILGTESFKIISKVEKMLGKIDQSINLEVAFPISNQMRKRFKGI